VSLDGVIEELAWAVPYWNDEIAKFEFDELYANGRTTFSNRGGAGRRLAAQRLNTFNLANDAAGACARLIPETKWKLRDSPLYLPAMAARRNS
jgi:hypothetical protein